MNPNPKRHPIYTGAFILTITGLFCRFLGFYYKIFLSRLIGPEELGLYQLALPLLALGIAFSNSGIHTAISKYVAAKDTISNHQKGKAYLIIGFILSLLLSLLFCLPAYLLSNEIATFVFHEPSIAPLLRIVVCCIPLECFHGCLNGYFYGKQSAVYPSLAQCIEQCIRVGSVFGIFFLLKNCHLPFTKFHAILGLLFGEIGSTIFYLTILSLHPTFKSLHQHSQTMLPLAKIKPVLKDICLLAYPITLSRILLTGINSIENMLIPQKLIAFGMHHTQALSIYGIFSGMAMPVILFPMVVANSIAVMLLPSISKAKETNNSKYICHTINLSFFLCMLLGFLCTIFFQYTSNILGNYVFHNRVAAIFIKTLSWISPFLFLGTTMNSILNGLGKTKDTFILGMLGALIRLLFVIIGIPKLGFRAFLLGIILSQIITSLLAYTLTYLDSKVLISKGLS